MFFRKFSFHWLLFLGMILFNSSSSSHASENRSLKLEISRSLDKALSWLHHEQNSSGGHWGTTQYPALTALALRATLGHPDQSESQKYQYKVHKGFEFLRSKVQSDGGIYGKGLASYNTSISLMAFLQKRTHRMNLLFEERDDFGEPTI